MLKAILSKFINYHTQPFKSRAQSIAPNPPRHFRRFTSSTHATVVVLGISALSVISLSLTPHPPAHATDITVTADVTQTLELSIPTHTISLDLSPDPTTAVFQSKSLTIGVGTNNPTGYTLNVSAASGATDLVNTSASGTSSSSSSSGSSSSSSGGSSGSSDSSDSPDSSSSSSDSSTATTPTLATLPALDGGYSENSFIVNRWGYKLNDATNYLAFPDTSTTALELGSSSAPTNDTITMTFGAKVDITQPAGTYELTLSYTAIANPVPNSIHYDANNGTEITALADVEPMNNLTLQVPDYYRTGYGFLGWSEDKHAVDHIGTATIYGPNQTIDASSWLGPHTLYAVWLKSSGNMQGWTGCSSLTAATYNSSTQIISYTDNTFIALTDTRQSNHGTQVGTAYQDTYAIARLTDGNCWMIENLRLGGTSAIALTTADSQSAGTVQATTNTFAKTSSAYTKQQINAANTVTTDSARTADSRYLYGNQYSWPQAINTTTAYVNWSDSPQDLSICPLGWRLPLGGDTSEYGTTNLSYAVLSTSQGGLSTGMTGTSSPTGAIVSARFRTFPNNFVYSGYWSDSSANGQGQFGNYWTTTATTNNGARRLYLGNTAIRPGSDGYSVKFDGISVRCVAAGP